MNYLQVQRVSTSSNEQFVIHFCKTDYQNQTKEVEMSYCQLRIDHWVLEKLKKGGHVPATQREVLTLLNQR